MTTILRIKGAHFGDPNLPVISPFIRNGLIGAFRPSSVDGSMVDLSGAGASTSVIGAPSFTAQGLLGNKVNGYKTNIPETQDYTIMATARIRLNGVTPGLEMGGFFAGNYNISGGAQPRGMSLFYSSGAGTVTGYSTGAWFQSHFKSSTPSVYQNSYGTGPILLDNVVPGPLASGISDWVFMALVVNTTTNMIEFYLPALSPTLPYMVQDVSSFGGDLATRLLTDPVTLGPNYMHVVSTPETGFYGLSQSEVSEALFYNRALTPTEIHQQYLSTQAFMAASRGITV